MSRLSRHAACKLPVSDRPKELPVRRKLFASTTGILEKVQKVSEDVSELKKNFAVETAATNQLEMAVEQLRIEAKEEKIHQHQQPQNITQLLMKKLPCKSLVEMDWLLAFIEDKSVEWTVYLKLLGGNDFNSSIKIAMNAIMDRSVQKQVSWAGFQNRKPSLKIKYKNIVDGIHVAMQENFKDYTIVQGEAKMKSMLQYAANCRS